MSKPIPKGGVPLLPPDARLRLFADRYGRSVSPEAAERFRKRTEELGLNFLDDEAAILASLDTPARIQDFLSAELYYNDDHASPDQDETAMPPRLVLRTGMAHCFEGALFAYAAAFLHGFDPRLVILEATQDAEHNIVVWRDARTGLLGSMAQSRYDGLTGRPPGYPTLRGLAESYVPFYYSDRTLDPKDLTLVGYSEEIDLVATYGAGWMAAEEPLWDIYFTYVDASRRFHYFRDDPGRPHAYPLIRALQEDWIRLDPAGVPRANPARLPEEALRLWDEFWKAYGPGDGPKPRGLAAEIEKDFFRLTGTTPIDLEDNAYDLQFYLAAGYSLERLLLKEAGCH